LTHLLDYEKWGKEDMKEEIETGEVSYLDVEPSGESAEYRDEGGTARKGLGIIGWLIIIVMAFPIISWGFMTIFNLPSPIFLDSSFRAVLQLEDFDSLENDYEALEIIAGTYSGRRVYSLQEEGTLEPIIRMFSSIYTFNQDRTFEIFQNEQLLDTGSLAVIRVEPGDDINQMSRLNQQAIESLLGYSEIGIYRIDLHSEGGHRAGLRQTFFMFRAGDERVVIYSPIDEDIVIVEQLSG